MVSPDKTVSKLINDGAAYFSLFPTKAASTYTPAVPCTVYLEQISYLCILCYLITHVSPYQQQAQ